MSAASERAAEQRALRALGEVRDWVFDLDNTLYPAECDLFAQIDQRMTGFLSRELSLEPAAARALQKQYYAEYGTTLNGLMQVYGLDPGAFLEEVHDIDLSPVAPDRELEQALAALPGRKFIYTNGSKGHAERVSAKLGITAVIDDVHAIECANYVPKPAADAFEGLVARFRITPARAAMFEDLARNLIPAHALGFSTVLVTSTRDWSHEPEAARPAGQGRERPAHVHHETADLTGFLLDILALHRR
jgi:putative hydrolase of the HAD superfamily